MFIPEVKWGKTNDGDECRKMARMMAKDINDTFGGDLEKMTSDIYEIIDTAFMVNKTYDDLVSFCGGIKETCILLATQSYIIVMGKICGSDIPIDAMEQLANAVFQTMSFCNMMSAIKETAVKLFVHSGMKRGRKHGDD